MGEMEQPHSSQPATAEPVATRPGRAVLRLAAGSVPLLACALVLALMGQSTERGHAPPRGPVMLTESSRARLIRAALSTASGGDAGHRVVATQGLLMQEIPGSSNASVVPQPEPPDLCTVKGKVWEVTPPKWFCGAPAHRTATCASCHGECLSPDAALANLCAANASAPFVGWNAQGGGLDSDTQSVTIMLPGLGQVGLAVRALLWANAGDGKHDPEWIKVWSSHDGEFFQLRAWLDVKALRGNSDITVLPLVATCPPFYSVSQTAAGCECVPTELDFTANATDNSSEVHGGERVECLPGNVDATSETHAKYWRINPGGIKFQSIPRSMGLCSTEDCARCGQPRAFFTWASDQPQSTFSQWLKRQPQPLSPPEPSRIPFRDVLNDQNVFDQDHSYIPWETTGQ